MAECSCWNFTGGFMTLTVPQINNTKQRTFPTPVLPRNMPKVSNSNTYWNVIMPFNTC